MPDVPDRYPVELNGRKLFATHEGGNFRRASVPLQRAQQDTGQQAGEQTLNSEDLWRRSIESWHRGAGQVAYDREGSDPNRFRSSLGVDPWEKWELSLLNTTEQKLASSSASLRLVVAGDHLYVADGQSLKFTTSITAGGVATWTTVTGTPAAAITGLTTNGNDVWVAFGADGLWRTTRGAASATSYNNLDSSVIAFVKGRVMASYDGSLYNVTGASDAITYRASRSSVFDASNNAMSPPTGTLENDVMVLAVIRPSNTSTVTPPTGWTQIEEATSADQQVSTFYKVASSSEGTINFTVTGMSNKGVALVASYYNVNVDDPVEVHGAQENASSTSVTAPSVSPTLGAATLVFIGVVNATTSFTAPAGFTERLDVATTGAQIRTATLADKGSVAAGATGTTTATAALAGTNIGSVLSLRPNVPDALFTHSATDFEFVGFAEGPGFIYAAGFSGDKSAIYRTAIRPDGTALDVPVVAASLPDGEIVRSIYGYLSFVFIGTDKGVRMAIADTNGDLTIGALIETGVPVRCFEGQERFVWFGWEDYSVSRWASGTYDGLGRIDLTQQIGELVPAYASDLMVTTSTSTTEQVTAIASFQGRRVLAVSGTSRGVYAETATKVAVGYLDSGEITYGISDPKVASYADLRHTALPAGSSVTVSLSADAGAFSSIGASSVALATKPTNALNAGPTRGDALELRLALARATDTTTGPTVRRITLRSEPAPARSRLLRVPLLLWEEMVDHNGVPVAYDVAVELAAIEALFDSQTLFTYKEYGQTYSAFLRDYEFIAEKPTNDGQFHQGTCLVTLKVPGR